MTPPAPDLLSTTQDWPQACWRKAASRRATMSVVPPGAAGTTMRMPWLGFQAAVGRGGARQQIGHRQGGGGGERGAAGKQAFHGFPRRSLNIVEVARNTRALANPPHFPYQFVVRLPPIPLLVKWGPRQGGYFEETHFRLRHGGAGCRRFCLDHRARPRASSPTAGTSIRRPTRARISSPGARPAARIRCSSASAGTASRRWSGTRTSGARPPSAPSC